METFGRIIKLSWVNFWRNRWLTLGATLLMTLTLTMISTSLLLTLLVRDTTDAVRQKIDLKVFFADDAVGDDKLEALANRIRSQENVVAVRIISKEEALAIFNRSTTVNDSIKKPLGSSYNPLPRTIEIKTGDAEQIQSVLSGLEVADSDKIICDDCISYYKNKELLDRLISQTRFVQRAGIFLSLFFGLIAIFNVLNIIRITIMARADEIEIMRFVGASNMFVRGPFLLEGVLYGLFGTLATTLFLLAAAQIVSQSFTTSVALLGVTFYQYLLSNVGLLVAVQLGIGLVLGLLVSFVSLRKYLSA